MEGQGHGKGKKMPVVWEEVSYHGVSVDSYRGWEVHGRVVRFGHSPLVVDGIMRQKGFVEVLTSVDSIKVNWDLVDYRRMNEELPPGVMWHTPIGVSAVEVLKLSDGSFFAHPLEGNFALMVFGSWDTAPYRGGAVIPTISGREGYRKFRGLYGPLSRYLSFDGGRVVIPG